MMMRFVIYFYLFIYLCSGLCLEKRVFYRLISGLHSSINIHLCAQYLLDGMTRPSQPTIITAITAIFMIIISIFIIIITLVFIFIVINITITSITVTNTIITYHHRHHHCLNLLRLTFSEGWGRSVWGPNVQEFRRRFDTAETKGEGTRRLKNLYFLYLLELRALSKVASYFERAFVHLYTGNQQEDGATKELLLRFFNQIK